MICKKSKYLIAHDIKIRCIIFTQSPLTYNTTVRSNFFTKRWSHLNKLVRAQKVFTFSMSISQACSTTCMDFYHKNRCTIYNSRKSDSLFSLHYLLYKVEACSTNSWKRFSVMVKCVSITNNLSLTTSNTISMRRDVFSRCCRS